MGALGDNHYTAINIPAQGDLGGGLAIFFADLGQDGVRKYTMFPFREGTPGFRHDLILRHQFQRIRLLEEWMQLHLVHHGGNLYSLADIRQHMGVAVANTNGFQLSSFICLFHSPISANVVTHRLMNQIQINVIQPEFFKGGLNGVLCFLIAGIADP